MHPFSHSQRGERWKEADKGVRSWLTFCTYIREYISEYERSQEKCSRKLFVVEGNVASGGEPKYII